MLARNIKYVAREVRYKSLFRGKVVDERTIMIYIHIKDKGIELPSPISDFILEYYHFGKRSISTEQGPANVVVQFFNFIIDKIKNENNYLELRKNGIESLSLDVAKDYLSYCSYQLGNKKDTVMLKGAYLTALFEYLWDKKVIKDDPSIKYHLNEKKKFRVNLFENGVDLARQDHTDKTKKKKDFTTPQTQDRLKLMREFILVAVREFPEIALAVAFQMFGGLRQGEVLNLLKSSVEPQGVDRYGRDGLLLNIENNQGLLFSHMKNTKKMQVKRVREQIVLNDAIVCFVLKKHYEYLAKLKYQNRVNNEKALFINPNTKLAMTGDAYISRYKSLKEKYLYYLSLTNGRFIDYLELRETRWSSHIGRGAFTNLCAELEVDETELAILRGDLSTQAAKSYIDRRNALNKAKIAIKRMNDAVKQLNEEEYVVNEQSNIKYKEVLDFARTSGV